MFEKQQKQITDSLNSTQASKSWLIVGPHGVGKAEFAKSVIKTLTGVFHEYNNAVQWISRGLTETAKKEIQKALLAGEQLEEKDWAKRTQITVEDVREGCRFLSLKSDKIKILVFDLAEEMNENAQNALLKTLEEPYPNTLILLLCETPGRLLPTILSRCQKLYLMPPSFQDFKQQIQQKHPELSADQLKELAFLSENIFDSADKILNNDGLNIYHQLVQLLQQPQKQTSQLISFIEYILKEHDRFELFKHFLLKYVSVQAKENALNSLNATAYLRSLRYLETKKQFEKIDSMNLDKKQSLISMFCKIGGIL